MPQASSRVGPMCVSRSNSRAANTLSCARSLTSGTSLLRAQVPLTTLGKNEAAEGATQMWREGYKVDVAYTSLLKRAQQTLDIVLKITGQEDVPVARPSTYLLPPPCTPPPSLPTHPPNHPPTHRVSRCTRTGG